MSKVLSVHRKVWGEYNSLLHKQSPPPQTNEKSGFPEPAEAGFVCIAAISNRQDTLNHNFA
ncbi:hypothetical protein Cal7507_3771 [Calothrix sp. PCC 7507]|nr:hypothetical protein Cal7507_3771 [Calothrix sp. PCC 7507]